MTPSSAYMENISHIQQIRVEKMTLNVYIVSDMTSIREKTTLQRTALKSAVWYFHLYSYWFKNVLQTRNFHEAKTEKQSHFIVHKHIIIIIHYGKFQTNQNETVKN